LDQLREDRAIKPPTGEDAYVLISPSGTQQVLFWCRWTTVPSYSMDLASPLIISPEDRIEIRRTHYIYVDDRRIGIEAVIPLDPKSLPWVIVDPPFLPVRFTCLMA
jgi:hypothetical protein